MGRKRRHVSGEAELQRIVNLRAQGLNFTEVADATGIPRGSLDGMFKRAEQMGLQPSPLSDEETKVLKLEQEVRDLRRELASVKRETVSSEVVRETILGLAKHDPTPPKWLSLPKKEKHAPGVPMTIWSDWHLGEVVDADVMNGVNEFNLSIAEERVKQLVEKTISLCFDHMVRPEYPGIVVNLLGDIFSGNIHEEIRRTNERPIMAVFVWAVDILAGALRTLADRFGNVFVVCAFGNHGRLDPRKMAKIQAHENFDWLLYAMLERFFQNDERIIIKNPVASDFLYRVYDTRYLATHGDQLGTRGGDGMIGAIGPIIRGEMKVSRTEAQIGRDFDMILMGHWHQLMWLPGDRGVVNGSLKGYDEFAKNFLRAPFERPRQALWFQHPEYITFQVPVYVDASKQRETAEWVSVMAG